MKKENISAKNVIGKIFMPSQIDERRTFTASVQETENDPKFKKFIEKNGYTNDRAGLIVFGEGTFMFVYGVLTDANVAAPTGLSRYQLPAAEVAQVETDGMGLIYFSQPVNITVPTFLDKLTKENVTIYENMGDSETPYILSDLNLSTKKLTQTYYIRASQN